MKYFSFGRQSKEHVSVISERDKWLDKFVCNWCYGIIKAEGMGKGVKRKENQWWISERFIINIGKGA